jgi:uncharacterized NAD(P)/FAD-binding protein YdhS
MVTRHSTSVAIVGAGASGALTAIQLLLRAQERGDWIEIRLVDPAASTGRGVAYGTSDPSHLLNVAASRLSAVAADPDHFLRWLCAHKGVRHPDAFVPRSWFGEYVEAALAEAVTSTNARLERIAHKVTEIHRREGECTIRLDNGKRFRSSHVVLALGSPRGPNPLLPSAILNSPMFVGDPWADGALDNVRRRADDVLLLGTGLTMVDVALSIARTDRRITAISRRGLLPQHHATDTTGRFPAPVLPDGSLHLDELQALVRGHVARARGDGIPWQTAIDSLRGVTNEAWSRLSDDDRRSFIAGPMRLWEVARHRVAPDVGERFEQLLRSRQLEVASGEVAAATDQSHRIEIFFTDGTTKTFGAVISCTGAGTLRGSTGPLGDLVGNLEYEGVVTLHALGMGLDVDNRGRAVGTDGCATPPVYVVGPLRRGGLWETTAIPEILAQADAVAHDIIASRPPRCARARQPEDLYGLPLTTSGTAADLFNEALGRLLRVQSGALEALERAVAVDPSFALGHAALAVLGHEFDADVDLQHHLEKAEQLTRRRGTERERRFTHAIRQRILGDSSLLIEHVDAEPRDVLAVSIAMPTIAFSGAYDVPEDAWRHLDRIAPSFPDDWWFDGLLAFARQERDQIDEARDLALRSLDAEPRAGTAAHALTHVHWESGDHEVGLAWLDPWIATAGRDATHLAHFSWHAALHELALDNTDAVIVRYRSQLAPPAVWGTRAMVDSASLLWRLAIEEELWPQDALSLIEASQGELRTPRTAFSGMHAALTWAVARDASGLLELERHCRRSSDAAMARLVAPFAAALRLFVAHQFDDAATVLLALIPTFGPVGGSAAQRSVLEDTAIAALLRAGDGQQACQLLDARLSRRSRPKDLVLRGKAQTTRPPWSSRAPR